MYLLCVVGGAPCARARTHEGCLVLPCVPLPSPVFPGAPLCSLLFPCVHLPSPAFTCLPLASSGFPCVHLCPPVPPCAALVTSNSSTQPTSAASTPSSPHPSASLETALRCLGRVGAAETRPSAPWQAPWVGGESLLLSTQCGVARCRAPVPFWVYLAQLARAACPTSTWQLCLFWAVQTRRL